MASSSSSSTSSSTLNHYKYEVFLSFRGEDTRHSFTSHLYEALLRAGISTFRDDDEIERGQQLKPEIEKAIKCSKASIVVLSENYATSRWCLDELLLILEQRRNLNHFVLPVFYHVDPSDVRNQRQRFDIEAKEGAEGLKWSEVNVNRWKAALTEVSNLTGMVLLGSETEFIANIVDTILCKLDIKLVSTPAHLTGMETRAECINLWLKTEQSSAEVLAICGMGGSGKTTLAQYIYNLNKHRFENSSFLQEIGKHNKESDGLFRLQKQLLKDILGGKNIDISNVCEGTSKIEEALQMKKVLIVLDDIDDHDELAALLGTKTSHSQSKIIITTRFLDINSWFGSISWGCRVNKLELLNDHESLELLSYHTFGSKVPMEGFEELSVKLAEYCEGNPLALKILGSSLFVNAKDPRERNNIIEIWRSTLNSLNSLKGDLDCKIQGVLQKSFDSLPRTSHKELFLHIACFFVGENEYLTVKILEDDLYAKAGIMTLINRCLLTVSPTQNLMMHQLLQEMGRKIVHEESKDPAKRSRVWHDNESYRLLVNGNGSETIEGLALDMPNLKKGTKSLVLKTGYLAKMDKLKLLKLKDVELKGTYNNFPELRWLCWNGCHSKTLPFGLLMSSSLVAIDLSYGNLEKFEPPTDLRFLKILNFRASHKLISICNLHRLPNLETLILGNCSSLTHVCRTIGGLESLSLLDLTWCNKLWKGSCSKTFVDRMERLKALCIGGGNTEQSLLSLPYSLQNLYLDFSDFGYNNYVPVVLHGQSLTSLGLSGCLFEFLPNNIDFKMLRVLNLTSCPNLKFILCLPSTLEELNTHFCESLEKITFQSARFRLRDIQYGGCIKLTEIQGLFKLVSVANLDGAELGHMKWIKAYEDNTVDLIGDKITKGRLWKFRLYIFLSNMLYEYGIKSTFLPGVKDESMTISDYTSASRSLLFRVPLYTKKRRIQGLNVMFLYRSSGEDKDMWTLLAKISNTTKNLTWIYNPVVYCKPRVDEDVVWLSYWPVGNILDTDDKVTVCIVVEKGMIVSKCRVSLVYTDDDDEVDQENFDNYTEGEEVIGGDLLEFEVTTGGYYLCRRDIFKSRTSFWLKTFFGDTVQYEDSRGWRKSRHTNYLSSTKRETYRDILRKSIMPGVSFDRTTETHKIEKIISRDVDDVTVTNRLREFRNSVNILQNQNKITLLRRYRNRTKTVLQGRIKVKISICILFLLVLIVCLQNGFV